MSYVVEDLFLVSHVDHDMQTLTNSTLNPHNPNLTTQASRPPPNKFFQISLRGHSKHKSPRRIRHNREILLLTPAFTIEKRLQLLQRRFHGD